MKLPRMPQRPKQPAEAKEEKSEKRPHSPRSGLVLKTSEEVRQQDAGEKAAHGESSEGDDDEQLAAELQKASSVTLTPRKGGGAGAGKWSQVG